MRARVATGPVLGLTWVDVVPAMAATALGVASVLIPDPSVAYEFTPPSPLLVGLAALATLPLIVRRLYPSSSYVIELAAVCSTAVLHGSTGILPGIVAFALAWAAFASTAVRAMVVLALTMLAFAGLGLVGAPYFDSPLALVTVAVFVACWAVGSAAARWRQAQRRAVDESEELREESERRAESARAEERRQLARELHDSVTNSITAIVLQLRALQAESTDPDARRAMGQIEQQSRDALSELRRLLGVLRFGTEIEDMAEGRPDSTTVDTVVESHRAQGGEVEVYIDAGVAATAHSLRSALARIVGELLANARRHAPTATTHLRLDLAGSTLRVHSWNAVTDQSAPEGRADSFGLIGIRERVALFDGTVEASGRDGEFHVLIEIPDAAR